MNFYVNKENENILPILSARVIKAQLQEILFWAICVLLLLLLCNTSEK